MVVDDCEVNIKKYIIISLDTYLVNLSALSANSGRVSIALRQCRKCEQMTGQSCDKKET